MMKPIDKSQELTGHLALNPSNNTLRITQKKKKWSEDHILCSIVSPQIIDNTKRKKIFKLKFFYKIKPDKKQRSHVIYFGQKDDYIFTKNKQKRVKKILKMKNLQNPFHQDYWSAHLANKYQTLQQGLNNFTKFFINQNNIDLNNKILKQEKININ